MDAEPVGRETGVWETLRLFVEKVRARLSDSDLTPSEFKDLSVALSNVAKAEIQSFQASRPPGRPPKDIGDEFSYEDTDEEEESTNG